MNVHENESNTTSKKAILWTRILKNHALHRSNKGYPIKGHDIILNVFNFIFKMIIITLKMDNIFVM